MDKDDTKQLASTAPVSQDTYMELDPGAILLKKYKVIGLLGRGGMGSVYRVEHLNLQKPFALKFLHKQQANDASWKRFEMEARAANKLDHPNLVKVHDSGLLADGQPYLIMDIVDGESLSEILKECGRLPLDRALKIFIQVGFALSYAHSNGVIHRDIKPSNIMIASTDTEDVHSVLVKVVDFGIAKLTGKDEFNQQTLTRTGEIFGSPLYMSPEQCMGTGIDQRTDLYSLGCVIFEALTGAPPLVGENALATMLMHQSENPASLKEASMGIEFPQKIESIVERLLEKDPNQRYQSAQHLTADLIALDSGQASMFEAPPRPAPVVRDKGHSIPLLLFGAICMTAIGVCAGWMTKTPVLKDNAQVRIDPNSYPNQLKPDSEENIAASNAREDDDEKLSKLEKTKGYFSHPGPQQGERIFDFPDFAIGNIFYSKHNMPPAQGQMSFRNFSGIAFVPSEQFQKHPVLFQKFRPDDIATLDLQSRAHLLNIGDRDLTAVNKALHGISHLTSIYQIDLGDTLLSTEAFLQINKLPKLRKLLLPRTNLSSEDIAKLNCLPNLIFLKLMGADTVKPILAKMRGSRELTCLVLSDCNVDTEDMKKIGEFKQLAILEVATNPKVNDDSLKYLPPNLEDLDLRNCSVTDKGAKYILRLKHLVSLRISSTGWGGKEIADMQKRFPNVVFYDGRIER